MAAVAREVLESVDARFCAKHNYHRRGRLHIHRRHGDDNRLSNFRPRQCLFADKRGAGEERKIGKIKKGGE